MSTGMEEPWLFHLSECHGDTPTTGRLNSTLKAEAKGEGVQETVPLVASDSSNTLNLTSDQLSHPVRNR